MRFRRFTLLVFLCCGFANVPFASIRSTAQEKSKEKPSTTVDAWREALPSSVESTATEEAPLSTNAKDDPRNAIMALEVRWMDSLKARDADSLSEIIAEEFTYSSPRMIHLNGRAKYLEYCLRDLKLVSYEFDKTAARIFGRAAIVTTVLKQKLTMKGENWEGDYVITDVWVNRGGTWRVVSRHESQTQKQSN